MKNLILSVLVGFILVVFGLSLLMSALKSSETYGCRIPKNYFTVTGAGESDYGPGKDHWETGSYDLALEDASIENFNVIQYTSVMPPQATQVTLEKAKKGFNHGGSIGNYYGLCKWKEKTAYLCRSWPYRLSTILCKSPFNCSFASSTVPLPSYSAANPPMNFPSTLTLQRVHQCMMLNILLKI